MVARLLTPLLLLLVGSVLINGFVIEVEELGPRSNTADARKLRRALDLNKTKEVSNDELPQQKRDTELPGSNLSAAETAANPDPAAAAKAKDQGDAAGDKPVNSPETKLRRLAEDIAGGMKEHLNAGDGSGSPPAAPAAPVNPGQKASDKIAEIDSFVKPQVEDFDYQADPSPGASDGAGHVHLSETNLHPKSREFVEHHWPDNDEPLAQAAQQNGKNIGSQSGTHVETVDDIRPPEIVVDEEQHTEDNPPGQSQNGKLPESASNSNPSGQPIPAEAVEEVPQQKSESGLLEQDGTSLSGVNIQEPSANGNKNPLKTGPVGLSGLALEGLQQRASELSPLSSGNRGGETSAGVNGSGGLTAPGGIGGALPEGPGAAVGPGQDTAGGRSSQQAPNSASPVKIQKKGPAESSLISSDPGPGAPNAPVLPEQGKQPSDPASTGPQSGAKRETPVNNEDQQREPSVNTAGNPNAPSLPEPGKMPNEPPVGAPQTRKRRQAPMNPEQGNSEKQKGEPQVETAGNPSVPSLPEPGKTSNEPAVGAPQTRRRRQAAANPEQTSNEEQQRGPQVETAENPSVPSLPELGKISNQPAVETPETRMKREIPLNNERTNYKKNDDHETRYSEDFASRNALLNDPHLVAYAMNDDTNEKRNYHDPQLYGDRHENQWNGFGSDQKGGSQIRDDFHDFVAEVPEKASSAGDISVPFAGAVEHLKALSLIETCFREYLHSEKVDASKISTLLLEPKVISYVKDCYYATMSSQERDTTDEDQPTEQVFDQKRSKCSGPGDCSPPKVVHDQKRNENLHLPSADYFRHPLSSSRQHKPMVPDQSYERHDRPNDHGYHPYHSPYAYPSAFGSYGKVEPVEATPTHQQSLPADAFPKRHHPHHQATLPSRDKMRHHQKFSEDPFVDFMDFYPLVDRSYHPLPASSHDFYHLDPYGHDRPYHAASDYNYLKSRRSVY